MLKISEYSFINTIFKKVQRAHEKVLADIFLPAGSGLATPDLTNTYVLVPCVIKKPNDVLLAISRAAL